MGTFDDRAELGDTGDVLVLDDAMSEPTTYRINQWQAEHGTIDGWDTTEVVNILKRAGVLVPVPVVPDYKAAAIVLLARLNWPLLDPDKRIPSSDSVRLATAVVDAALGAGNGVADA